MSNINVDLSEILEAMRIILGMSPYAVDVSAGLVNIALLLKDDSAKDQGIKIGYAPMIFPVIENADIPNSSAKLSTFDIPDTVVKDAPIMGAQMTFIKLYKNVSEHPIFVDKIPAILSDGPI